MFKKDVEEKLLEAKAVLGERRIRKGDPDVYLSADSARVRSRQLGCIGIRRYATIDGGEAWMPCTNESDYRRYTGVGPQAARDRAKREREFVKRVIKKKSTIVSQPHVNTKADKPIDNRFIVSKTRAHNQEMKLAGRDERYMATPSMLQRIWDKEIKNGPKQAMKRVNIFLSVLSGGAPKNLRYISDISLLPEGHPRKSSVKTKRLSFNNHGI